MSVISHLLRKEIRLANQYSWASIGPSKKGGFWDPDSTTIAIRYGSLDISMFSRRRHIPYGRRLQRHDSFIHSFIHSNSFHYGEVSTEVRT